MQKKKAISLIVLVITIIVMIILASAIIMSLDNANIFNKAEAATDKYTGTQEKQKIQIAVLNAAEMGGVNEINLTESLNEEFNEGWEYFTKAEDYCVVRVKSSQRKYEIGFEGKTEEYQETEIITDKSFFKYSGNTITGLSEYGKETLTGLAGKNVKLVIPEGFTSLSKLYTDNPTSLDNLKNLSIYAEYITSIYNQAFQGCKSLVSIYAPNVTKTNTFVFAECTNLTNVYMPQLIDVKASSFWKCTNLINVDVSAATIVEYGAFRQCKSLVDISIPNVTTIEGGAFGNCESLTNAYMPKVVEMSGECTFEGCTNLTNVDISNITTIGGAAFRYCKNLISVETKSLTTVESNAFHSCTKLSNIDLSKVTSIGGYAFFNCASLTSADLSNATTIGEKAFYLCTNLANIKFSKLESVGNYSFNGNYNGEIIINYTGTMEEWGQITRVEGNSTLTKAKIICSDGTINE